MAVGSFSNSKKRLLIKNFPKAKIIADKFHVIRLIVWVMENVRKAIEEDRLTEFREVFYRKYYK